MGSANSMVCIDVYISYPDKTKYIELLENNLKSLNYYVINSSIVKNSINEIPSSQEISKNINLLLEKTNFIIICLSNDSFKSYSQSFELNEIIENVNFDKNKIIYLILDENNENLENYIKNKRWYPFYDEESYKNSIDKILSIVFSS